MLEHVQNKFAEMGRKNETTSVNSNEDCTGEHMMNELYWDSYFEGYSPISFPCLTGLRPEVDSGLTE